MKALFQNGPFPQNETASSLYEKLNKLPIYDPFTRLPAKILAEDRPYTNIYELLFKDDKDAETLFRCAGVPEKYLSENASDYEKFRAIMALFPNLSGTEFYQNIRLFLSVFFGIRDFPDENTCDSIWKKTAEMLFENELSPSVILSKLNAESISVATDPKDGTEAFDVIRRNGKIKTDVRPVFCPDSIFSFSKKGYNAYIKKLETVTGISINDLPSLKNAYSTVLDKFEKVGCRSAYHGFDGFLYLSKPDHYHAGLVFEELLSTDGQVYDREKLSVFKGELLRFFFTEYEKRNMKVRLQISARQNPTDLSLLLDFIGEKAKLPDMIFSGSPDSLLTLCENPCGRIRFSTDKASTDLPKIPALGSLLGFSSQSTGFAGLLSHDLFRRKLSSHLASLMENGFLPNSDEAYRIDENIIYKNIKIFNGETV